MIRSSVQETLAKYDIQHEQLHAWEDALGIHIPTDKQGQKLYTRQHLNLFKNVKKHLALGRSLDQIKRIITLPPTESAQPIDRNIKSAWQHAPNIQNGLKPSAVTAPAAPALVSSQSESLLAEFSESAETLIQQSNAPEQEVPLNDLNTLDASIQELVDQQNALDAIEINSPPAIDDIDAIEAIDAPTSLDAALEAHVPAEVTLNSDALEPAASIMPTVAVTAPEIPHATTANTSSYIIERVSKEASPHAAMVAKSVPLATVSVEAPAQSLQIVDRLLTEKDSLQQRLIEAEKLNSHLYNVNALFNKKVKELTELVQKMKASYNEADMMKLMEEKSALQRQLLTAEREKLEAQRKAERAANIATQAHQSETHLHNELHAQRAGFKPNRFLGNWKELVTLREIQYDTFGLNVEEQREQHRLIDVAPSRIIGNVAFFTTRFAYPDNELWQRIETLTCVYLDDSIAQGDLQVDYILDGVPVCRAIYTANLERIS